MEVCYGTAVNKGPNKEQGTRRKYRGKVMERFKSDYLNKTESFQSLAENCLMENRKGAKATLPKYDCSPNLKWLEKILLVKEVAERSAQIHRSGGIICWHDQF